MPKPMPIQWRKIDVSGYVGSWPFRKSRYGTFADLRKVYESNGITQGFVSSLQSVFWNDPMEAEEELADTLRGGEPLHGRGYHQICTLNPMLPEIGKRIGEAVERFGVRAVRICPGYHGYRLDDTCVEPLHEALVKYKLPLFVTLRMQDYRLNYVVTPRVIELDELRHIAAAMPEVRLLYSTIQTGELLELANVVNERENVFADTSCLKEPTDCMELVLKKIDSQKLLYGSAYPLYALKSSLCEVETAHIPDEDKRRILCENAERFFRL